MQVGNTHATRKAILFKNLDYILRECYDILSEDARNYPVSTPHGTCCWVALPPRSRDPQTWAEA